MADKIDDDEESSDDGEGDTGDDALICDDCGETVDSFLDFARHDRGDSCDES